MVENNTSFAKYSENNEVDLTSLNDLTKGQIKPHHSFPPTFGLSIDNDKSFDIETKH